MKTPDETAQDPSPAVPSAADSSGGAGEPGWVRRVIRGLILIIRGLIRRLRSIRFAIILMALIAAASLVGTLIEQGPYHADAAMARYGRTLGLLIGLLGLNQLYREWWFLTLLALLALSVAVCTFSGARFSLRKTFTLITHASILLIVAGAILRGVAGIDGTLALEKGQTAADFAVEGAAAPVPLGFRLRLDDFLIRYYEGTGDSLEVRFGDAGPTFTIPVEVGKVVPLDREGRKLEVLRRVLDFKMDENGQILSAPDQQPNNPAVQVQLTGPAGESKRWVFSMHPEFEGHAPDAAGIHLRYVFSPPAVKSYESHVTVLDENGNKIREAVILVNSPLSVGRYTFYQMSYNPKSMGTVLEVTHDPGVPLVFAGFLLLPLGVALAFYAKPLLNRKARGDA
jgi:cytochrome c biogenesis protein